MEEEVRRIQVNFTFEKFEGQDEISSEATPFQREEVELAKPFLSLAVLQGVESSPVCLISALNVGALAYIAYSRCGRTKAPQSGINAALDIYESSSGSPWFFTSSKIVLQGRYCCAFGDV